MADTESYQNPDPRCPRCGFTMCEQFDDKPINAVASLAIPNGSYRCYHCAPSPRHELTSHLIAAAPEMYDALKLFMTCYPSAIAAMSDEQRQTIEAAIQKAEGK